MKTQPATQRSQSATRPPGRPRRPEVDESILQAALELLTERGVEGTTMSAVVARSGVARATVYRRWPNRDALVAAAVRRAMGRPPQRLTGDLEADLRRSTQHMRETLAESTFRTVLPAVVRGLTRGAGSPGISYDAIAPIRTAMAEQYRALAPETGLRDDVQAELVVDLITGGLLGHLLATGEPPTTDEAAQVADVLLDGLRVRAG